MAGCSKSGVIHDSYTAELFPIETNYIDDNIEHKKILFEKNNFYLEKHFCYESW